MDDEFKKRIEIKIDKIDDKMGSIDITLAKQHVSLEEHMKRTNILETNMIPVQDHVRFMQTTGKLIAKIAGAIVGLSVVLAGVVALLAYLKS